MWYKEINEWKHVGKIRCQGGTFVCKESCINDGNKISQCNIPGKMALTLLIERLKF